MELLPSAFPDVQGAMMRRKGALKPQKRAWMLSHDGFPWRNCAFLVQNGVKKPLLSRLAGSNFASHSKFFLWRRATK